MMPLGRPTCEGVTGNGERLNGARPSILANNYVMEIHEAGTSMLGTNHRLTANVEGTLAEQRGKRKCPARWSNTRLWPRLLGTIAKPLPLGIRAFPAASGSGIQHRRRNEERGVVEPG